MKVAWRRTRPGVCRSEIRKLCFSSDRELPLIRLRAASWIDPPLPPSITPEQEIPPKFPNFGKTFPYLPGKGRH